MRSEYKLIFERSKEGRRGYQLFSSPDTLAYF